MWWLAQAANPAPNAQPGDLLIPALWLVGGLVIAAGILVAVRKWGKQPTTPDDDIHEQLARFRHSYQQGQMSKAEYERVHALLAERIRQQTGIAPPSATETEPSPAPIARPPRESAEFEPTDGEASPEQR